MFDSTHRPVSRSLSRRLNPSSHPTQERLVTPIHTRTSCDANNSQDGTAMENSQSGSEVGVVGDASDGFRFINITKKKTSRWSRYLHMHLRPLLSVHPIAFGGFQHPADSKWVDLATARGLKATAMKYLQKLQEKNKEVRGLKHLEKTWFSQRTLE